MKRSKIIQLLLMFLLLPGQIIAEEREVVEDEYILSISETRADLAIDLFEDSTGKSLEPTVGEYITVVRAGDESADPEAGESDISDSEIVEYSRSADLCVRFNSARKRIAASVNKMIKNGARPDIKDLLSARLKINCEANGIIHSAAVPNDQYYSLEWGLPAIKAPEAWNVQQGKSTTIVAIIDSGVDYNHLDLNGNMWRNPGEIAANGVDDDGNGYVDDLYGINTINGSGNPMDDNGHGTHCAGTIGAKTNNGVGISGVSWNVQMIAVKFLGSNGSGSYADAVEALDYVTNLRKRGIRVVASNNSWGSTYYSSAVFDAVKRSTNAGVLTIAAAGNDSSNNDSTPHYPSNYADPGVIAVGATNSNGDLASFSNYGATTVHIAAPGETIASTYPNNRYVYLSGTSMATPHVTGAIALLASHSPNLDWSQLKGILLNNASTMQSLSGKVVGSRFLNLAAMLTGAASPPPALPTPTPTPTPTATPTPTPVPTPQPGNWDITVNAVGDSGPLEGVTVTLQTSKGTKSSFVTGPSGKGSFLQVSGPTNYSLTLEKLGYVTRSATAYLTANATHTLSLSGEAYRLTVKTVNGMGLPLDGVLVDGGKLGTQLTDGAQTTFNVQYGSDYKFSGALSGYYCKNLPESRVFGNATRVIMCKKQL